MKRIRKFTAAIALILVLTSFGPHVHGADADVKCYVCEPSDPNCVNDPTKAKLELCTTKKCYTKSVGGKISRGCSPEQSTCENPGCYECTTDSCNNHLICKNCTSLTDPDCSQTDASKESYNSVCPKSQNSCISFIRDDKHLERRCAKADDICANDVTCNICKPGVNCNVGVFPSARIRCYQCPLTESKCGDVVTNSDSLKSKPCLLYTNDDKCYTFGTSATTVLRGCVSDPNTELNKCSQPGSNEACSTCDKDNCNNLPYQRDPIMKCVQCNSTADAECQYEQKKDKATACKEKVAYNQKESCYYETLPDKSVRRGCVHDRLEAYGACKEPECKTCDSGDGCNIQSNATFSCIICRSDIDSKCGDEQGDDAQGATCRNQDLITENNKNCFSGVWNKVIIRGCLLDADARQQVVCNDENDKQCIKCTGKDCNKVKWNGASSIKITSSLLALIALFSWLLH